MLVSLLIPIYRNLDERFMNSLKWFLKARVENLDAAIEVKKWSEWVLKLDLQGSDAETAALFMKNQFGTERSMENLLKEKEYMGNVARIQEENIVVDIGIRTPEFYLYIPFESFFKDVLALERNVSSTHFRDFGIRKYFPLSLTLENLVPVAREDYLRGKIGNESLSMFKEWLNLPYNRVLVYGETRGQIKEAISKSGHGQDILNIERLGFLECSIVCKEGTSARGLIPEIGPYLKTAELTSFQVTSLNTLKEGNNAEAKANKG